MAEPFTLILATTNKQVVASNLAVNAWNEDLPMAERVASAEALQRQLAKLLLALAENKNGIAKTGNLSKISGTDL